MIRNIQEQIETSGQPRSPPDFLRYGVHFTSERVPFGALVEFLPATYHKKVDYAKMGPKTIPCIFV